MAYGFRDNYEKAEFLDENGGLYVPGGMVARNGQGKDQFVVRGDTTYSYVELDACIPGTSKILRLLSNANGNIGLYDPAESAWLVRNDINGNTYIGNGSVTVGGHSSPIGTILTARLASTKSVSPSTSTEICSITLSAGTWMLIGNVRFPGDASGVRRINIATQSGVDYDHIQQNNAGTAITQMQITYTETITANTTFYLNAWHNSNSALTMPTGTADGYTNGMRAVRIA